MGTDKPDELAFAGVFLIFLAAMAVLLLQPKTHFSYSGLVVEKHYTPSRTETYYTRTCTRSGDTETCTTTPHTRYVPAEYYLTVKGNDEERVISVTEQRYDSSYEGDTRVTIDCYTGKWVQLTSCSAR